MPMVGVSTSAVMMFAIAAHRVHDAARDDGSPTALRADATVRIEAVGAGAFMVKEWVRDDYLDLVSNPDYWDKTKPGVDAVRVRLIADQQRPEPKPSRPARPT